MSTKCKKIHRILIWLAALPVLVLILYLCMGAFAPMPSAPDNSLDKPVGENYALFSEMLVMPYETASVSDWNLALVNPSNTIAQDYKITLTQLKDGQSIDERCYPDLQEMMDACRAEGLLPIICSSYRTSEDQQKLFDNKVNSLIAIGYPQETAKAEAAKTVAIPGTSEHQLGLALDIVDQNNQNLDETQEDTPVQQWLMENSWKYGFILRYPESKSDITGIIYEPWHYRYVGRDTAQYMYENDICLEEYLELVKG